MLIVDIDILNRLDACIAACRLVGINGMSLSLDYELLHQLQLQLQRQKEIET